MSQNSTAGNLVNIIDTTKQWSRSKTGYAVCRTSQSSHIFSIHFAL